MGRIVVKAIHVLLLSLLLPTWLQAQGGAAPNQGASPAPKAAAVDTVAIQRRIAAHVDLGVNTRWRSVRDSLFYAKYNKYGDLKDDDPVYNVKKPWWFVAIKVTGGNVFTNVVDRYALGYDYAKVGFRSWRHNLRTGWEWDQDRFGMNFFFHPYSGASYYNSARSSGYNCYGSFPFTVGGSLMWEYFGETTLPSYNDIINTSLSGAFFGEIFYRLSSNILDDRATGGHRRFLELAAAAVDPARGFSRLTSGHAFRHTPKQIYQKEPLNVTLCTGVRKLNHGKGFGTGSASTTFNLNLDYGNPFEKRSRKPFDYFKLRTDLNYGAGRKILDNINGLGILAGTNVQYGPLEALVGLFQHYDYWDNKEFELGTIMFGGGGASKLPLGPHANLYTSLHLGVVPLAGNSTRFGPDTLQIRDYNYGGGLGGKYEGTLALGRAADLAIAGYYYWIHTYVGYKGDHYIGILRPRLEIRVFRNFSVGAEHFVYYSDRYPAGLPAIHKVQTEQRVFLKLLLEQFRRQG